MCTNTSRKTERPGKYRESPAGGEREEKGAKKREKNITKGTTAAGVRGGKPETTQGREWHNARDGMRGEVGFSHHRRERLTLRALSKIIRERDRATRWSGECRAGFFFIPSEAESVWPCSHLHHT